MLVAFRCPSVARRYEHLILDGPGLGQHIPVLLPEPGPGGGEEKDFYILGDLAEEVAEAQVIADGQTAFMAVQGEGAEIFAALENLIFLAGGEEMHLVVGGDFLPCAVKDVAGIVDFSCGRVQPCYGTAHDIYLIFSCEDRQQGAVFFAVLVGIVRHGTGEKADIPHFGQDQHIGLFLQGGLCHTQESSYVFLRLAQDGVHLQKGYFQVNHLVDK